MLFSKEEKSYNRQISCVFISNECVKDTIFGGSNVKKSGTILDFKEKYYMHIRNFPQTFLEDRK